MKTMKTKSTVCTALAGLLLIAGAAGAAQLSGAIFTTTKDGAVVNENVRYEAKEDVYLDGGPGPNAPSTAAGLPQGDYYFQVTDPSGKDLLSSDHISCRKIHVNASGVIDQVYSGYNLIKQSGRWALASCQHLSGMDQDHSSLGAITVQLFPYDDTPNPGGVYKAWITPVDEYAGKADPSTSSCLGTTGQCNVNGENYQAGNFHGFIPSKTKTDNYKVKQKGKVFVSPEITVRKFHDRNVNGVQDLGEEDVTGWAVSVTDPSAITNIVFTTATVVAEPSGPWTFVESRPAGTLETASYLDGALVSSYPSADPTVVVAVAGTSEEKHAVVYGNVGLGSIKACKVYDRNGNGRADTDEPGIPGWRMQLTGTNVRGATVSAVQTTGGDGCTSFGSLLPGTYTVTELIPSQGGWSATGSTSASFTIESSLSGASMTGTAATHAFTNLCFGTADFGTKGYWHNINGLAELTGSDIAFVNGLSPYSSPSSYFDDGDEPFDGVFSNGTPVAAGEGAIGLIAPAGSVLAEVSHFLVDANATGDPREQLAQQLLAFIFNTRHRLDDPAAMVRLPDGTLVSASGLVNQAIAAWASGSAADQHAIESLLDALNNSDALTFVHFNACAVAY